MRKLYILFLLALVSCIREEAQQHKITIILDRVPVKSTFSDDRTKLVWVSGDKIGIYHDGEGVQNIVAEYAGDHKLQVAVPYGASNVYALYPYDSENGSIPTAASVTIPSMQIQEIPGILDGDRLAMSASACIENSQASMKFSPLTAILALNIYSSDPEPGESVKSVCITPTENTGFAGQSQIDLTCSSAAFTTGDESGPVTLTLTESHPLVNTPPKDNMLFDDQLYAVIAKQSYKYVKFEIITDAGRKYTLTSNERAMNCVDKDVVVVNINLSEGKISLVENIGTEELIEEDCTLSSLVDVLQGPTISDITDDMIPDFSRVGYHYGDDEIPYYTNVIATLYPTGDKTDRSAEIQEALDRADGITNSVVVLTEGDYYVNTTLKIRKSHLVLRGEGGAKGNIRTRIIATGDGKMNSCLQIGERNNPSLDPLCTTEIIEDYVPVGRLSFCVADASRFNVGDHVVIYRPGTARWIHDLRMDQISDGENWEASDYHLKHERIITGIAGNRIMIDAPIVMALDAYYGGGYMIKMSEIRICESGIEDIFVESIYNPDITKTPADEGYSSYSGIYHDDIIYVDENHCNNGVKVVSCEHCWVKSLSGQHFISSLVSLDDGSRNITILDCHSYYPISEIKGSRRYAFYLTGMASLALVKNCSAEYDRHQFVTTKCTPGPIVFTDCTATKCLSETGPHCFWATGVLYDYVRIDSGRISVQDSDYNGTGVSHGWQGANFVFWNCEAPKLVCQSPWQVEGRNSLGKNYCIGCIGTKYLSTTRYNKIGDYLNDRPNGEWYPDPGEHGTNTEHVISGTYYGATANGLSLYQAQLDQRKATGQRVIPAEWYN